MHVKRIIWTLLSALIFPIWFWVSGYEFERGPGAFLLVYFMLTVSLLVWFLPMWEE